MADSGGGAARPQPAESAVLSCCADLYSHPLAAALLGEFFHPGGSGLTARLAGLLDLRPGQRVLDVASGRAATGRLLAERYGCRVVAVEQSAELVAAARAAAGEAGLHDRVEVLRGEADALPLPSAGFDAVVCECALCTFARPEAAVAEWCRVLRPGGRLGLADVTRRGELPEALDSLLGRVACVAGARSPEGYRDLLHAGGFEVTSTQRCDQVLADLAARVEQGLLAADILQRVGGRGLPDGLLQQGRDLLRLGRAAIADGRLGYCLFVARRATGGPPAAGPVTA